VTARILIDLSHPIEPGMTTYPGLPGPVVSDFLSREDSRRKYAAGTTFQIGRIEMVANTGTYVDAPFHRIAGGQDIAGLPLERVADLEGLVVTLPPLPAGVDAGEGQTRGRAFDADLFERRDFEGKAVLLRSGWDSYWRTPPYGRGHPFVTRRAAEVLVSAQPSLVGIDSVNIDDTDDGTRPAHTLLLQAGIPIVEHLCNLSALPAEGFRFHCAPAPFLGVGSFPVRAYAVIGKDAA
jgi:kynurenine formamidase